MAEATALKAAQCGFESHWGHVVRGEGNCMDMNEVVNFLDRNKPADDVHVLQSTGSVAIDKALGGGYGVGRIVELYGDFATFKTTLAMYAVASAQRRGRVLWMDSGEGFNVQHAHNCGVNVADLQVFACDDALDALRIIAGHAKDYALFVVDSAAQLDVPEGVDWFDEFDAVKASGASVIFVSYLRITKDNEFAAKMRHYASQRVQTMPGVGRGHCQVVITKNCFAPPHPFDIQLRFNSLAQLDQAYELGRLADRLGLLEHGNGSWIYFDNDAYHGVTGLVNEMTHSPSLSTKIRNAITAAR